MVKAVLIALFARCTPAYVCENICGAYYSAMWSSTCIETFGVKTECLYRASEVQCIGPAWP